MNNLSKMYRLQGNSKPLQSVMHNAPVKRVIISSFGKIEFNPDERRFIYFSKTNTHHVYYIFNKVIKIIIDELNRNHDTLIYNKLGLPSQIMPYHFYNQSYKSIIKNVKDFFKNYLPENCLELVTFNYLHTFSEFLLKASTSNKCKKNQGLPEISDTRMFGGAYGINDAWLELLKACIVSSEQTKLNLDNFFDFILDNSYRGANCRVTLKQVLLKNPEFFNLLNILTYAELKNPDFYNKNNINKMKQSISEIEEKHLYNSNITLSKQDFLQVKKQLKQEIIETRSL